MKIRSVSKRLLPLLLTALLSSNAADAAQVLDARDGDRITAQISLREPTRIKVEGEAISGLVGDVYNDKTNPNGRIAYEADKEKGEVIVRLRDESLRPVNLFVSTPKATYTLVFKVADMPADTVILRDRTPAAKQDGDNFVVKAPSYHRLLKNMLVSMAVGVPQFGVELREIGADQVLWAEARLTLQRSYYAPQVVGDQYVLTNRSGKDMVLTEQEFDKDGVLAVSIENQRLRDGEFTNVFVIRSRGEDE